MQISKFCVIKTLTTFILSTPTKSVIKHLELLQSQSNERAKSALGELTELGDYSCGVQFDRGEARRGGNVRKIEFPCRQSRLRRRGANTAHTAPARAPTRAIPRAATTRQVPRATRDLHLAQILI